jgi:transposase-like protein
VAIGIRMDGSKEALGLWVSATEGAKQQAARRV